MTDIPPWVRRYIGIPYDERGRGPDKVDCYGLVRMVWENEFGLDLPEFGGEYGPGPDNVKEERQRVAQCFREYGYATGDWTPVAPGEERCGDGVLLRLMGFPIHVGVVVAPGMMLHCERGFDSALDRYDGMRWQKRLVGFWRHKSLA